MRAAGNAFIATLAIAAAFLCVGIAVPETVRVASALCLLLVLPGLALTRALFPARGLGAAETLLLSIALSVSLAVVGSLVLHVSPFGLTRGSWAAFLAGFALVAAGIAEARARRSHGPESPSSSSTPRADQGRPAPFIRGRWLIHGAVFGLALGVAVIAMSTARAPLPARGVEGYTALWLLPSDRGARYLDVGVQSSELETTRYRLEIRAGRGRALTYRFVLATGADWRATLRVRRGWSGAVRARLYRASAPTKLYRRARLLVDA